MIILTECPICDKENWHSLDEMRDQNLWYERDYREDGEAIGWKICKECGFVTYDMCGEDRQRDNYTRQRGVVQANSIITSNRKLCYHDAFIQDEWIKPSMKILDVGCAQGNMLNWLHEIHGVPKDNLYGTEHAEGLISWGKYEYGLNMSKQIDTSIKYDFISYYHVFEHVEDITKEINMIKDILADHGYLYLSIPIFFEDLEEKSGMACIDFEEYYHLNHIQCFSRKSFNNFLNKHGLEVIKVDEVLYAYTVMCKKSKPIDKIEKENYLEIVSTIELQKKAIELLIQKKYEEAIKAYRKYPDVYLLYALSNENMKEEKKQCNILERGLKEIPDSPKLLNQLGKAYMQWDENTADKQFYSNNIKKAEKIFIRLLELKPGVEESYYFLGIIEGKYKKDYDKANEYLTKFVEANPIKYGETVPMMSTFWRNKYNESN